MALTVLALQVMDELCENNSDILVILWLSKLFNEVDKRTTQFKLLTCRTVNTQRRVS